MARNMSRMKRQSIDPADIVGCDEDCECVEFNHDGIEHQTPLAALVKLEGEKTWIPKKCIVDASETSVSIATWWAEKEGWL